MGYNASGFILHYKEYKAAFYVLFSAIWMWKSPRFFLCQWIKMPTLLKVTCALCPQEKAAKIPAVEADRSISQVFPPLSYPSPAVFGIISWIAFIICWVLGNISLYFSAYLPNRPSGPLGFLWPSGEIFYEAWHPLEHQKLFPRMDWGPVPPLTHTALHRLRKKPISCRELFFSHTGETCQKKWPPSNWDEKEDFFFSSLFYSRHCSRTSAKFWEVVIIISVFQTSQ